MNSKQRRKQRVFEHEITLVCHDEQHYFEFDRRVEEATDWLQCQTKRDKRKNYILGDRTYKSQTFKFRNGNIASFFALRWT